MPEHRAYIVNDDGRFIRAVDFETLDDEGAKQLVDVAMGARVLACYDKT